MVRWLCCGFIVCRWLLFMFWCVVCLGFLCVDIFMYFRCGCWVGFIYCIGMLLLVLVNFSVSVLVLVMVMFIVVVKVGLFSVLLIYIMWVVLNVVVLVVIVWVYYSLVCVLVSVWCFGVCGVFMLWWCFVGVVLWFIMCVVWCVW